MTLTRATRHIGLQELEVSSLELFSDLKQVHAES